MRRDPLEQGIFVVGIILTGLLAVMCRKKGFPPQKSFIIGFVFGLIWVGFVGAISATLPQYSSVQYQPLLIGVLSFLVGITSGGWCAYEAYRGTNS